MFQNLEIIELPLSLKSNRQTIKNFLSDNELDISRLDYYAGIFKNNEMVAGGGLEGNVIKCIAVHPKAREHNLACKLIGHLRAVVLEQGYNNMFVYTKPQNETIFTNLAFNLVGRSADAILLESNPNGISDYCKKLSVKKTEGKNGCIIMNCNPMTLGHRYLIREASLMVDTLHVIIVSENKSEFSSSDRLQMVKDGVADLKNVKVHEGEKYVVSSASFPCYFLKCVNDVTKTQIELDLNIFCRHIAPALNIDVRFIGTEPYDKLTGKYNDAIKEILAVSGIKVIEVERLRIDDKPISASYVRQLIKNWNIQEACLIVPPTSKPYILKKCAELIAAHAVDALKEELNTTPKPGLIDKNDTGAHTDMDYCLMRSSINVIGTYFFRLAEFAIKHHDSPQEKISEYIRAIGIEAENEMLKKTKGINTHKGAIFSIGLCVTAVAIIIASQKEPTLANIAETISFIAKDFQRQENTNGAIACRQYNIKGVLDYAKEGYSEILSKAFPLYRELISKGTERNTANIKTLLYIMTFLDDTNIYHRKGIEEAREVKEKALAVFQHYNEVKVYDLNRLFIQKNISPGGCADMLALILFTDRILT